jgi:lysyl-tRNA synthetase class 2
VPSILAGYLVLLALVCAARAVLLKPLAHTTALGWPFAVIEALGLPAWPNLGYAAYLAVVAGSVARRKRIGLWLAVALFGLELVGDLAWLAVIPFLGDLVSDRDLHRFAPELPRVIALQALNAALVVGALAVLFAARREFAARVQRASLRRAGLTLAGGLLAAFLVGWLLLLIAPGNLHARRSRADWLVRRLLDSAIPDPEMTLRGGPPHLISLLTGLCTAVALFAALFVLVKSQRAAASLPPGDERRIRALLAAHGARDSLGYFATRRDKSAVFSPSGKAAVTYRVVAGVCLASGDPLGDTEAWGPAIDAWLAMVREYAWRPAVVGAGEAGAHAYARAGLKVLHLGDEAIVEVAGFSLDGREMRGVRQAVRRVERAGYTARIRRHADIPPDEMERVIARTAAWRDTETERGFSMALDRLGDPADGRCVLVEALAPDGTEAAVLSLVPWGPDGLSLDLMRRDRESDNGLVEFMVAALVSAAPRLGVGRISLNFAVFRSVFEEGSRIGAGPVLRLWRKLLLFFSRWWQIESLYRSNVKYRPQWTPRFLCYGDTRDVARVGIASAIAEGFLTVPSLTTLLSRGRDHQPVVVEQVEAEVERDIQIRNTGNRIPEQMRIRLSTVERLRAEGVDPYPVGFTPTDDCAAVRARHAGLAPDRNTGETVRVAGRVVLARDLGGVCFARIRDWSGDVQVMLTAALPAGRLRRWRSDVDLGDHVGVCGEVVTSRTGELSVLASSWTLTAKCLRPLPDKRRGLTDPEARVRQRHVDLAVNPAARRTLAARSAAVRSLRESLHRRGYLEVETPILQRVHGGANARPFTTTSNAYDLDLYLRIAPELYLKRLCVAGVDRVFELGRTFRNEGADATHNPEFTMLEAYQAYADYRTMLALARSLVQDAAVAANGSTVLRRTAADGTVSEVDIGGEWPVRTVDGAVSEALGEQVTADTPGERLAKLADRAGVPHDPAWGRGALLLELYERLVEHRTGAPTFYTDFPTDVSPLTRAHRDDPRLAERWDLVAFGAEIGTAYTELTDPVEQRRRLTEQSLRAAGGDPEAMELDEDFLSALEFAMPPTGGLGLGVDRLVMLLTGLSIRDTLPFPLVR